MRYTYLFMVWIPTLLWVKAMSILYWWQCSETRDFQSSEDSDHGLIHLHVILKWRQHGPL